MRYTNHFKFRFLLNYQYIIVSTWYRHYI